MEDIVVDEEAKKNWFYIIIQDPGSATEQYVGFSDNDSDEKFIPAFKTKDDAKDCFKLLPKDIFNGTYDTQAVIKEDLLKVAEENGHTLYLLDGKGSILDTIN